LRGDAATPAWDLWALAVVAYEMLAGVHPFVAANTEEWQRTARAGQLTPLAAHLSDAPARCQEFFDHALASDLERRPHSAGMFFSHLQSALA
jgi:serine/threonine-protein kinase